MQTTVIPSDLVTLHQFVAFILFNGIVGLILTRKFNWVIGVSFFYFASSATYLFLGLKPVYPEIQGLLDRACAASYAQIVIITAIASLARHKAKLRIYQLLNILFTLDALILMFIPYGMFNNNAMDTALIVSFLPYALTHWNLILPAALAISLYRFGGGSTVYVALIAMITVGLAQGWKKGWSRVLPLLAIGLTGVLAYLSQKEHLFESTGRMYTWMNMMDWWFYNSNLFFGTGTGTFYWICPLLQKIVEKTNNLWPTLHNEYLQVLFEQGILGLTLFLTILYSTFRTAWRKGSWHLYSLTAISITMLTQFPLRFAISALFMAMLTGDLNAKKETS